MSAFTGRTRNRKTHWSVKLGDTVARSLITIGGVGTIIAVPGVCLFLLWEVCPLFFSSEVDSRGSVDVAWGETTPVHIEADEYRVMAFAFLSDGTLHSFELESGETIESRKLFGDRNVTASSFSILGDTVAFGFDDGSVQIGSIEFKTTFMDEDAIPEELQSMETGEIRRHGNSIVQVTPKGQFRRRRSRLILRIPFRPKPPGRSDPSIVSSIRVRRSSSRSAIIRNCSLGRLRISVLAGVMIHSRVC